MKPAPFRYHRPTSLPAALEILARLGDEAKVLAGGQSLVPLMNLRLARPSDLVDINRIPELDHLGIDGNNLHIGATTRWATVERSPQVALGWPLLATAIHSVGHPQIRNRGTVGGSAAHADPAAELPAVLVALNALIKIESMRGIRRVHASEFFLGVFTTDLMPDELLTEIVIPGPAAGARFGFAEFARRQGDFALAGAACVIAEEVRLVGFGAGSKPEPLPPPDQAGNRALHDAVGRLEISSDIHGDAEWRRALLVEMAIRAYRQAAA